MRRPLRHRVGHWFFFAQVDKPEQAIMADPDAWYGGSADEMGARLLTTKRQFSALASSME